METKLKSLNLNEIESDSDEEELEETNVDVGLIEDDPEELSPEDRKLAAMRLRSPFFPSKVGGKPAWLDFSQVSNVSLTCESCKSQMAFLLQIYAPVSGKDQPLESPIDCFHRVLYVFVCNSNQCTLKTAKLVRSQMRRQNEFYSYEAPPQEDSYDSDADYDLACFKHLKSFNSNLYAKNLFNLCSVCGFSCAKKCSKCFFVCFCSQSHQIIDWTTLSHKSLCSKYAELKQNNENEKLIESWTEDEISIRSFIKSPAVFPEREIVIEPEVLDEKRLLKNSKDNKFDENSIFSLL